MVLAVSGGADSMALAHLMLKHFPHLDYTVAHLHHGLRAEADGDEALVRDFAAAHGVAFASCHRDIAALAEARGQGIEETGREERYGFFRRLGGDVILTAHHKDDQAETLLLHLLRGSGLRGLCGISPLSHGIGRPLLAVTKEEIYAYCAAEGIVYRDDATNGDTAYTRNKIRKELLPLMAEINPAVTDALFRLGETVAADEAYLEGLAASAYEARRQRRGDEVFLPFSAFPFDEVALIRRQLRMAAAECGVILSFERTEAILGLGAGKRLPLTTGLWVYRDYNGFAFGPPRQTEVNFAPLILPQKGEVTSADGRYTVTTDLIAEKFRGDAACRGCFDAALFAEDRPVLRLRRPGDYVQRSGGRKKLSRYLIDAKIPADRRDGLLLLAAGQRVLWIVGAGFFAGPGSVNLEVNIIEKMC